MAALNLGSIFKTNTKREIRNLLIKPRQQLKFVFLLFGCGVAALVSFIIFFMVFLKGTIAQLSTSYGIDPEVTLALHAAVNWALVGTVFLSVILIASFLLAGLIVSHRVFGPMVPMQRLLGELKSGNYAARGKLRKSDEFHELMDSMNDLAKSLEQRHGSNRSA